MKRLEVFPQWMYEFEVEGEIIERAVSELETANFPDRVTTLNDRPQFQFLRERLNDALEEVRKDLRLMCGRLEVSLFWVNMSRRTDWNEAHWHANSWASGILYLTGSDSHTLFSRSPWWSEEGNITLYGKEREEFFPYTTNPGHGIIFPSHLVHSVSPHGGDNTRYAIAFNAFPTGALGDSLLTQLNLSVG